MCSGIRALGERMSTYTTLDTARTAYLANADYADGAGDVTKAQDFRSACRSLLVLLPSSAQSSGAGATSTSWSLDKIAAELKTVEAWLASGVAGENSRSCRWTRARAIP